MESITCPCCQLTSHNPNNVAHRFCGRCHWWTSDPELAPHHFALPCEHRAQGVIVPRLGAWHRDARMIYRPDPDPPPCVSAMYLPFEMDPAAPWLHTMPGTLLELSGTIRRRPLPWWRRCHWKRHLRAIRRLIGKLFNGTP